jgi:hypothetical protein
MSLYKRYRIAYKPQGVQRLSSSMTSNQTLPCLNLIGMKFYNFFMKFVYEKEDRRDRLKWKTQDIVVGSRSLEIEQYKIDQIRWVSDPITNERRKSSYTEKFAFVQECKKRIGVFLDDLDHYAVDRIDLRPIINEGYKVTIESKLRPRPQTRLRPRAYGFHYNTIVPQVPSPTMHVAYLWGGESSGFHSYNSAFNTISRI